MANSDRRYTYRLDVTNDRVRVSAPSLGHKRVAPAWLSYLANVLSLRQVAEGG